MTVSTMLDREVDLNSILCGFCRLSDLRYLEETF